MAPPTGERRARCRSRRGVQPHARPALGGVPRPARVRRRRLARAAHAADRDPRTARGAGRAGGPAGRRGPAGRATRAGGDHAGSAGSSTICCCSPRPSRPTSCAASRSTCTRSSTDLWDGVSLTAERHFELGPVPDGNASRPIPTGSPRRSQPRAQRDRAHRAADTGSCASRSSASRPDRIRFAVIDDGPGNPGRRARADLRALPPHRPGAHALGGRRRSRSRDRPRDRRGTRRAGARAGLRATATAPASSFVLPGFRPALTSTRAVVLPLALGR